MNSGSYSSREINGCLNAKINGFPLEASDRDFITLDYSEEFVISNGNFLYFISKVKKFLN